MPPSTGPSSPSWPPAGSLPRRSRSSSPARAAPGKSHIAQALGHAAVRADYDVLFTTQSQLLASLNAARAINAYERRFQTFARVALLVIDDFGLKPLRAPSGRGLPRSHGRAL